VYLNTTKPSRWQGGCSAHQFGPLSQYSGGLAERRSRTWRGLLGCASCGANPTLHRLTARVTGILQVPQYFAHHAISACKYCRTGNSPNLRRGSLGVRIGFEIIPAPIPGVSRETSPVWSAVAMLPPCRPTPASQPAPGCAQACCPTAEAWLQHSTTAPNTYRANI